MALYGLKQLHDVSSFSKRDASQIGYVHRDLKPANMAIGRKGTQQARQVPRVSSKGSGSCTSSTSDSPASSSSARRAPSTSAVPVSGRSSGSLSTSRAKKQRDDALLLDLVPREDGARPRRRPLESALPARRAARALALVRLAVPRPSSTVTRGQGQARGARDEDPHARRGAPRQLARRLPRHRRASPVGSFSQTNASSAR